MMHTVIADDEALAREKLKVLLNGEPDIAIVGESTTGPDTIELVRETHPELLFLDIRMPGMDGFDIFEALSKDVESVLPKIIFTTAYDTYAIRAFEINAVDYLLKPFSAERLHAAVERVRHHQRGMGEASASAVKDDGGGAHFIQRIVFKSRGKILFLPVSDLRCIAAEENYVRLVTESESYLLRETMSRMELKLDPDQFLRVHRSFMVNIAFVKEIRTEKHGELVVFLDNGAKVPMSRSYKSRLNELLSH
ncbi:MAG TPA: LytTR family DNA-binding domain-containing protein [Terracidiphilus sp.]|nr:LytTR family DNA-binding domain-containing protein [Terracidiphilus sp.]